MSREKEQAPKPEKEELTEDQLEAVNGGSLVYLNRNRQKELLTVQKVSGGNIKAET